MGYKRVLFDVGGGNGHAFTRVLDFSIENNILYKVIVEDVGSDGHSTVQKTLYYPIANYVCVTVEE